MTLCTNGALANHWLAIWSLQSSPAATAKPRRRLLLMWLSKNKRIQTWGRANEWVRGTRHRQSSLDVSGFRLPTGSHGKSDRNWLAQVTLVIYTQKHQDQTSRSAFRTPHSHDAHHQLMMMVNYWRNKITCLCCETSTEKLILLKRMIAVICMPSYLKARSDEWSCNKLVSEKNVTKKERLKQSDT